MNHLRQIVLSAWREGISAVNGRHLVKRYLEEAENYSVDYILAVGKAAASMCEGALDVVGSECSVLIITKYNHTPGRLKEFQNIKVIEAGHPIPDENSLHAGNAAIQFIKYAKPSNNLLVLASGGASALVEDLAGDMSLEDLQSFTTRMIAQGYTIDQINTLRQKISNIKGGKLLREFQGNSILVLGISDVPSNEINVIGSGLADPSFAPNVAKQHMLSKIIGKNEDARSAVANLALALNIPVIETGENLYGDLYQLSKALVSKLENGPEGFYIWGGEPTIELPENPGRGGRNQSLALAIAQGIKGMKHIAVIAAGTDGTDGPTDAAGGLVDGETFTPDEEATSALTLANAGPFLDSKECLVKTGPTGTNVMDLVIGLKLNDQLAKKAFDRLSNISST